MFYHPHNYDTVRRLVRAFDYYAQEAVIVAAYRILEGKRMRGMGTVDAMRHAMNSNPKLSDTAREEGMRLFRQMVKTWEGFSGDLDYPERDLQVHGSAQEQLEQAIEKGQTFHKRYSYGKSQHELVAHVARWVARQGHYFNDIKRELRPVI